MHSTRATWWDALSDADKEAAMVEWKRISDRAEATKKAMIRVREGMPYLAVGGG